jgi:flagellar motor protein MotB
MNIHKHPVASALAVVLLIGTGLSLSPQKISATEAGPNGVNVGFDFTWDDSANPAGHSASFLETDGITANNCSGGTMTATTKTCNFVFDYRVNGTVQATTSHAARWITWSNPTSYVDGKPTGSGCSSPTSGSGDLGKAPLTLFDCFNTGSLGQVFRPKVTGPLNQFRMSMTCLTPSGTARYDLYALLYELNPEGTTLTGNSPLGATLVNLTKCPTASTWRNKTFKAADFSMMPMSFNNAQVTAGKFYGVYMTGTGMPGALPPGAAAAMAAAKAATTTTTVPPTTTTTTPWSRFKGENNRTATAGPASPTATVAPSVSNALTVLGATRVNRSAVRLMSPALSTRYYINSLTPNVCLGAGRNLVFLRTGRCTARVQLRSNGKLVSTVTTRVVSGDVVASDEVVPVAPATVAYFRSGTGLTTSATKKAIAALAPSARTADAVLVTGHTGNIQGENSNLIPLSQKRAQAVRSLLRDRGVRTTIAIWSYGASQPISKGKTAKEQNLNRRAEIFIIPK